jgi:hypothetical protein
MDRAEAEAAATAAAAAETETQRAKIRTDETLNSEIKNWGSASKGAHTANIPLGGSYSRVVEYFFVGSTANRNPGWV